MAVAEDTTDVVIEERAAPMTRRLLAEFVGTLVFVAVGTGTATVMALGPLRALGGISEAFGETGQEPLFEGLLSNQLGDVFPVAFAFATALAVLVYALGGISGAHFNPAVTFSLAVARRFKWSEVPIYWVVQILGGIAGAFIIAAIYGHGEPSGAQALFGGTVISAGVNEFQGLLAEAFITFILVTAIMAIAVDPRAPKGWSGLIIGLGLAAGILVTSAATGGSANFARSLGPFVASLLFDHPPIPWADLLIYAAGPLLGGAAASLVYESVTGLEEISPAPRPGAATGSPVVDGDVHYDATADEGLHDHPHDYGEGKGPTH